MKKLLSVLVVLAMVFSLAACGGGEEPVAATEAATEAAPAATEAATEAAPAATEAVPAETAAAEPEEAVSDSDVVDLVISLIELSIGDSFDYYEIDGDETSIELSVSTDGLAEAMYDALTAGYDENFEQWVEVKNNFSSLCDTIYETAVDLGMDDPLVFVHILNDQNYENTLLTIMNGIVVYDAMAE